MLCKTLLFIFLIALLFTKTVRFLMASIILGIASMLTVGVASGAVILLIAIAIKFLF